MAIKLKEIGLQVESSVQKNLVRVLKEQACFTSLDFEADITQNDRFIKEYALPDSSTVKIGSERFLIPELMFQPSLNNIECDSIVKGIINSIELCDIDLRRDLYQNIFLTGGSSMFPFFEIRLKQELEKELARSGKMATNVRIIAPKERVFSNWVGGSVLSMIPEFQTNWMTRKRFYDEGLSDEMLNA